MLTFHRHSAMGMGLADPRVPLITEMRKDMCEEMCNGDGAR